MIVLHLALVMRRLRAGGPGEQASVQDLFDYFCRDMDHSLREMGVSDVGVPREMRKFGEAFYGRSAAYDRALDADGAAALVAALARNVLGLPEGEEPEGAVRLAFYVRRCSEVLAQQEPSALAAGVIAFPATSAALHVATVEEGAPT
jgi:cytochrome b pre-mRNA-processing protein 3